MARVAAASREKMPLFRLLSLMAVSWACLPQPQTHTNQTFQSAENVPEHQADSAAVVGFGWANGEAGTVVRWRPVRFWVFLARPTQEDMFSCVFCETRNFANM